MARRIRQFSRPGFEPRLSKAERKSQGIYYTPPEIVERIVELVIGPLLSAKCDPARPIRVLDPSCGAGEFLVAAYQRLRSSFDAQNARESVWGIDIDSAATTKARSRLLSVDGSFCPQQVITGDALLTSQFAPESFDGIVGNPPYVNIRQLAKTVSEQQVETFRKLFSTARGNFDLYVLFIERAIQLLPPGGRCGLIIPGKWATLDYAHECRKLLLSKTTIEHVVDLSSAKVFAAASVYPHILVFKKAVATASHLVRVSGVNDQELNAVRQASLSEQAIQFSRLLDVESRVATAPLDSLADISCGTAGYAAQKIAQRIIDAVKTEPAEQNNAADFITSSNIDRYSIRLGDVRYLNRHYSRPRLPISAPELTPAKRQLFRGQKIVVAGMSRRLEAAWDGSGLALGVQVYAISEIQVDPFYLLALLNSKLLSYLFATRFAAKRLGGGYFSINKGQLTRLPIRVSAATDVTFDRKIRQVSQLARDWNVSHDTLIDHLVYELYQLSETEIARVEGHFAELAARAA